MLHNTKRSQPCTSMDKGVEAAWVIFAYQPPWLTIPAVVSDTRRHIQQVSLQAACHIPSETAKMFSFIVLISVPLWIIAGGGGGSSSSRRSYQVDPSWTSICVTQEIRNREILHKTVIMLGHIPFPAFITSICCPICSLSFFLLRWRLGRVEGSESIVVGAPRTGTRGWRSAISTDAGDRMRLQDTASSVGQAASVERTEAVERNTVSQEQVQGFITFW